MDAKKIALLVGALMIAGFTAFMAKNMFADASAPVAAAAPAVAGPEILVATRALPVGTIITADSFKYQPWPKEMIDGAYYKKGETDINALAGTVVRSVITAGQPVTLGALVKPGDRGFLAAALGPGMRAVTISVNEQKGVAGFIFPGDRVDIVLSQSISGGDSGGTLNASETIVRNVRVLATNQRTVAEDEKGERKVEVFQTVTVEATPRLAEKLAVAQQIGDLSLSLRSIADNAAELERAIAAGEVSVPNGTDPKAEKDMLSIAASRPTDASTTFVTGGDVSRYQRRTVPKSGPSAQSAPATPVFAAAPAAQAAARPAAPAAPVKPKGPVVRVWRGGQPVEVEVGGN
jgi:pilus assembly protein CpaB